MPTSVKQYDLSFPSMPGETESCLARVVNAPQGRLMTSGKMRSGEELTDKFLPFPVP